MFFFGVFGIQGKEKEIRDVSNITCKRCGRFSSYKLVKAYNYFHIFFIPIFKWGIKYFLVSRCCISVFQIPEELGRKLEAGENIPVGDEDLRLVYSNNHSDIKTECPNCRNVIDGEFQYCPHCGAKVK